MNLDGDVRFAGGAWERFHEETWVAIGAPAMSIPPVVDELLGSSPGETPQLDQSTDDSTEDNPDKAPAAKDDAK
jgi:hypothetical protein